ncbi:MAG: M16 family metallopeptidase [Hyphomonadaceae bacterium]
MSASRRFAWAALAGALVLAAAAGACAKTAAVPLAPIAAQAPRGVAVQGVVSPGGIKAWLVSDSTVPMIVVNAYWRGGSASDPQGKEGAAGVLAAMLGEGAGDLDETAFKVRLEELNATVDFGSGWDGMSLDLVTLTKNRDAVFEMARLALASPRFDAPPLARIKRQSLIGIRQRETNPGFISNLALDTALIPGHPYARRTSLASIGGLTKADLEGRRKALLARDNLIITVAGDIDAATLGALLDKTFGVLPATAAAAAVADVAPKAGQGVIVKPLPQPQSVVLFAAPGIQDEDPDWIPLAVANYILGGGGFSSRLMDEVREKNGLVYGIGTAPTIYDHAAYVRGQAQTSNANVGKAIAMIKTEMARLRAEGPTQAEVDDAKRYLTGSFPLELDSNEKIAGRLQGFQIQGRDIGYVNRRNALIAAVTREDVVRVIARLFDPARFTFVVVGEPEGVGP